VAKKKGRAEIVSLTIKNTEWWHDVAKLGLRINERVKRKGDRPEDREFAQYLLLLGAGTYPTCPEIGDDVVSIPDKYIFKSTNMDDFIKWVYPDILDAEIDAQDKAILAPLNKEVDTLNNRCLELMEGACKILESADCIVNEGEQHDIELYPTEFLNSLNITGLPPHMLILKVGAPVILLRNIDFERGLCNGTRLIVLSMGPRLLKLQVMNGTHAKSITYLPRIDLITAPGTMPFILRRRQFPIKLAFAVTINKAQGQSLKVTGIYLPTPVFSHGQYYVANSRSGNPDTTKVFQPLDILNRRHTKNVVFSEVL
jgi:ATP-dependent DNA helicase PIF1